MLLLSLPCADEVSVDFRSGLLFHLIAASFSTRQDAGLEVGLNAQARAPERLVVIGVKTTGFDVGFDL